jgi:phosphohistidine phosphatase
LLLWERADMELYLVRHAVALEREEYKGKDDAERPLTTDGRNKMRRAARGMRRLGLSFDLILSSPFARARDTADIVAHEFTNRRHLKLCEHLRPGGRQKELIKTLQKLRVHSVVLVGHEPDLSKLLARLAGVKSSQTLKLRKGAVCLLSIDEIRNGPCAQIEWILHSKHLERIAR